MPPCAGCRSAEAQCRSTVIRGLRTMPEGTALRCGRACTMAHGDTFALGHAVEADCGALTIGGAAHAHRGAAAQGASRRGVRAVVNREIRGATCSRQGRVELVDVDRIGVVDAGGGMRPAAVEIERKSVGKGKSG